MKSVKSIKSLVLAIVFLAGVVGCSKNSAKKILAPEEVSKSLATVLCDKYMGCQKEGTAPMTKEQCQTNITTGIAERIKSKAELKVEQGMVDKCVKAITAAACEVLSSDTPPEGCEFLK